MAQMGWDQILNRAIAKEQEAHSNYMALSKRVVHPGSRQMLTDLAREEQGHKELLEAWRDGKIQGTPPVHLPELGVAAKGHDIKFDKELTPEETVRFAIREEEMAFAFYDQLAKGLEGSEAKTLAERLAAEEKRHRFKLEVLLEEETFREM